MPKLLVLLWEPWNSGVESAILGLIPVSHKLASVALMHLTSGGVCCGAWRCEHSGLLLPGGYTLRAAAAPVPRGQSPTAVFLGTYSSLQALCRCLGSEVSIRSLSLFIGSLL